MTNGLQNTKDREKSLKKKKLDNKNQITCKGIAIRLTTKFLISESKGQKTVE